MVGHETTSFLRLNGVCVIVCVFTYFNSDTSKNKGGAKYSRLRA
jgi:hypothetical protein